MAVKEQKEIFSELFNSRLSELYEVEKKCQKVYKRLLKAIYTSELRTAVSPSSTELETHLERLKLIMKLQQIKSGKLKDDKKYPFPDLTIISSLTSRKKSIRHDADIILNTMVIQNYKIAVYDFLHSASLELKLEQPAILLEQCIKDNKNTYAWLLQILNNIVNPGISQFA